MVTVAAPVVAVLVAVNVSTLLLVVGLVPKEAVTPLGSPETVRATLPVNPFRLVTAIVSAAVFPCARGKEDVAGSIVNPGVVDAAATKVVMLCAGSE